MEEWRQIDGCLPGYAVSSLGRVRSPRGLMRCGVHGGGQVGVCLRTVQREQKYFVVHSLVWRAFRGAAGRRVHLAHANGDKTDNRIDNLRLRKSVRRQKTAFTLADLPGEQWASCLLMPEGYLVSSEGRLKRPNGRLSKGSKDADGYDRVHLSFGTGRRTLAIHTLVAAAFLGERPPGAVIRHLDDNPSNNKVSNLRYGTQSENMRDALANRARLLAKIDVARADKMRRLFFQFEMTCEQIAHMQGISTRDVERIILRKKAA